MTPVVFSSRHARQFQSVMVTGRVSGTLDGCRPKDIAPNLFKITHPKNRTVAAALQRHTWIRDIRRAEGLALVHAHEFFKLWGMLQNTQLNQNQEDQIKWKLTKTGEYTAASAYKAQFIAMSMCQKYKGSGRLGRRPNVNSSPGW